MKRDWKVTNSLLAVLLSMVLTFSLVGCGGGGGGGTSDGGGGTVKSKVTLSGTAATGAPITGATITIRDAAGTISTTTTNSSDGSYTIELTGTAPWILKVPKPGATGQYIYSYAGGGGTATAITANIHPLTDPILRTWFKVQGYNIDTVFDSYGTSTAVPTPKDTEIAVIKAVVKEVVKDYLAAVGVPADFDPISSTFAANSSGFDKVLDGATVNTSGSTLNIAVVPGSALDTAVTTSGGNTTVSINTNSISLAEDITAPVAPISLSALAVSSTQVLLTWSASTSTDALGYKVFKDGTEVATVTSTVYIVPALTASTLYSFTIKAFDAAKNLSDASSSASATTQAAAADTILPAAPTGLNATPVSSSQIDLSWTASTDNVGVVGYRVLRGGIPIAKVFTTTFSDTGLTPGTQYTYTVQAFDGALNLSVASSSATTTTSAATTDTTAPTVPAGLSATAVSSSEIDISWTASTDAVGVVGYYVYRDGSKVATVTATSYNDINLASKTTYSYTVKAFDLAGNVSAASASASATTSAAADTTAPTAPTSLTATATAGSTTQIGLSWTASTDAVGVVGYYVYRDGSKVATVTATSYSDTGLAANTTYSYTVEAFDLAGNRSAVASTSAKTNQYADVSSLIAAAKAALENQDIATAKATFLTAYAANPTNKDAAFGAAMTEGIMLLEDPDVANIIQQWNGYAPTVKNIVYGALTNTFEVYGGSAPYCGNDPVNNGFTKLTTASTASPYTYTGSYTYYIVHTLPFSQVQLDAVTASTGNASNLYCSYGDMSGYNMGVAGDSVSVTLGGQSFSGSSWTIKANAASTGVTVTTVGSATAKKPGLPSGTSLTESTEVLTQLGNIMNKLPQNRTTLFQKVKRAAASSFPTTAPSVSTMQSVIDNKILPVISDMITKLRVVEGTGYTFTITPAMTGGAQTSSTVLDDGEFYAIDAALSGLNSGFNILTAYNLDVDYNIIEADPLSILNGPTGGLTSTVDSTKFFTLKTTGAAKMTTALNSLKEASDKAKLCYTFVFDQWGYTGTTYLWPSKTVTDNGLRWHDPNNMYSFLKTDDTDIRNLMAAGSLVLKGQVTYTDTVIGGSRTETVTDGTTTVTLKSGPEYGPNSTKSVTFNATKFFTTPLDRTDLPTMGYDLPIDGTLSQQYKSPVNSINSATQEVVYSSTWQKSDIPDKTFNAIFPNNFPDMDAMIYLDKAVLLDSAAWYGWNDVMASDGTSIYLHNHLAATSLTGSTTKIWKINPTTGAVEATYTLGLGSGANKISWINNITWHNGTVWASGGYYDASSSYKNGVFKINFTTGLSESQITSPSVSCGTSCTQSANIGGIASDGTDLFAGIGYWDGTNWQAGIVKFATAATEIPSTPFIIKTDDTPNRMSYDGTSLWVSANGVMNVNPSTGAIIKSYAGPDSAAGLYLNSRLWTVEDKKLLSFVAP